MDQSFMKERPIFPLVLAMSIPNVLSMLVNSLYNIVDSFFVAKISEDAMTAISLVFPIQNINLAIAVGFSIGLNALIAFLLGMGQEEKASQAATVGMVMCVVHGFVLMVTCIAILPQFLGMFSENQEVISMGIRYCVIVLMFGIPHHLYIGMEKVYQALGKMKTCMLAMMLGCITNIILDPILIFGIGPFPEMGIAGAAIATGIGQFISLMYYVVSYLVKPIPIKFTRKNLKFEKPVLARMYGVGIPASLTMALPSLLISTLNRILSAYSQVYIVVLGIYYKLQTFVYMPANGLIQGIRPLVGYNFGAKEDKRVKKIYNVSLLLSIGMMCIGTVICFIFPENLMGMFSTNTETIKAGGAALAIIAIGFIPSSVSITSCGALEGLGMGVQSLMISLLRYTVVIIPTAFILCKSFGPLGVWHAFWITEVLTAIVAYILYERVVSKSKIRREKKEQE